MFLSFDIGMIVFGKGVENDERSTTSTDFNWLFLELADDEVGNAILVRCFLGIDVE